MSKLKYIFFLYVFILMFFYGCQINKNTDEILGKSNSIVNKDFDLWATFNYNERQGKQIFDKYCVICHGKKGKGDGFNAFNLNPKPQNLQDSLFNAKISDQFLSQVISLGGRGVNKSSQMPAYLNTISSIQINYVIDYLRKLSNTRPK